MKLNKPETPERTVIRFFTYKGSKLLKVGKTKSVYDAPLETVEQLVEDALTKAAKKVGAAKKRQ